jgi:hypothetical protein
MTQQTYQGKIVKSSRPARDGDPGYAIGGVEQVTITLDDGTEKTVKKSEVITTK